MKVHAPIVNGRLLPAPSPRSTAPSPFSTAELAALRASDAPARRAMLLEESPRVFAELLRLAAARKKIEALKDAAIRGGEPLTAAVTLAVYKVLSTVLESDAEPRTIPAPMAPVRRKCTTCDGDGGGYSEPYPDSAWLACVDCDGEGSVPV